MACRWCRRCQIYNSMVRMNCWLGMLPERRLALFIPDTYAP